MVTVLNKEKSLSTSLGEALGQGLQTYANHKLKRLHEQEAEKLLIEIGFEPELAKVVVKTGDLKKILSHPETLYNANKHLETKRLSQQGQTNYEGVNLGNQFQSTLNPQSNMVTPGMPHDRPSTDNILKSLSNKQPAQPIQGAQLFQNSPGSPGSPGNVNNVGFQGAPISSGFQPSQAMMPAQQQRSGPFSAPKLSGVNGGEDPNIKAQRDAYYRAQERSTIAKEEETANFKKVYEQNRHQFKVLNKAKKLLAQEGSSTNIKQSTIGKFVSGEALQPTNAGLLDQLRSEFLGSNPTTAEQKAAELIFPSSNDSKALQIKKLDNLIDNNREEKSILLTRDNVALANGGQVPEEFDAVLQQVTESNGQKLFEKNSQLSQEEQERYKNPPKDRHDEGVVGTAIRNVVSGVSKGGLSPYNIATLPERLGSNQEKYFDEKNKKRFEESLKSGNLNEFQAKNVQKSLENLYEKQENKPLLSRAVQASDEIIDKVASSVFPKDYLKTEHPVEQLVQDGIAAISNAYLYFGMPLSAMPQLLKHVAIGKTANGIVDQGLKASGFSDDVSGAVGVAAEIFAPMFTEAFNVNRIKKYFTPELQSNIKELDKIAGDHLVDITSLKNPIKEVKTNTNYHKKVKYGKILNEINKKNTHNIDLDNIFIGGKPVSGMSDVSQKVIKEALEGNKKLEMPLKELYGFKKQISDNVADGLTKLEPIRKKTIEIMNDVKVPGYADLRKKTDMSYSILHQAEELDGFVKQAFNSVNLKNPLYSVRKMFTALFHNDATEAVKLLGNLYKTEGITKVSDIFTKNKISKVNKYILDAFKAASEHRTGDFLNIATRLSNLK